MSMTRREEAARAIGFLEGMSSIVWSLDRSDVPVSVCCEAAAFYDQQVETLRKAVFDDKELTINVVDPKQKEC